MGDDPDPIEPYNQDAVDLLVDCYGLEGAERRLHGALSEVRQRKAEVAS